MKKHRLRQLRIKRIDLVDQGAAVEPAVTLFKRREPVTKDATQTMTLADVLAAMPEEQRKVVEAAIAESAKKLQEGAPPAEEKPPEGAPPTPPPPKEPQAKEEPPMPEPTKDPKPEEMKEAFEKRLIEERAAIEKQLREDFAKKLEAAEKQATEDRERVAKMLDENLERECIAKAQKFPRGMVGLSMQEGAQILKSLRQKKPLTDEQADKLEKHFAAVESMTAASAVFKELGSGFGGESADPAQQLRAIAKSLKEKDANLSDATAYDRACELNPKLYEEARAS